jgi:hypothetical protein
MKLTFDVPREFMPFVLLMVLFLASAHLWSTVTIDSDPTFVRFIAGTTKTLGGALLLAFLFGVLGYLTREDKDNNQN